jgi:hypothetical protein
MIARDRAAGPAGWTALGRVLFVPREASVVYENHKNGQKGH